MRRIIAMLMAMLMMLSLCACGASEEAHAAAPAAEAVTGVEDGVLTVGMECAYAPYN